MNRNEIEEKDRQTVQKIRTIVENKEKRTSRKKAFWAAPGFWLLVLCIGGGAFGLIALMKPSTTDVPQVAEQSSTPEMAMPAAPVAEKTDKTVEQTVLANAKNDTPTDDTEVPADSPPSGEKIAPEAASTPAPAESAEPEEVSSSSPAESTAPAITIAGSSNTVATDAAKQSGLAAKPSVSPGIQITDLVTCGGVRDKQYVSAKSVFSLAADPIVMVWMRVLSDNPPLTLTHVYSINGKHYCDVPLQIPYPHMRTWSQVTIDRDIHIGQWRVEVVTDNGVILDQVEFTVVPKAT